MLKLKISLILTLIIILFSDLLLASDPGDKIEDFTLKNYDGTKYTLSKLNDSKAVVIMFWSVQCPFVQGYNDRINEFTSEYQKKGITFLAINANNTESLDEIKSHTKEHNYPFPVLRDENNLIANKLGATRTPEIFVVSNDRIILYHGRIDDNKDKEKVTSYDLRNALDEIIEGKEVSVKTTKSFGCTIKKIEDKD